jgi:nitroreductase
MTKSKQDEIPREIVERVIESGTWGPNHRRTCPWRFVVLTGGARNDLGDVMAEAYRRQQPDAFAVVTEEQLEKERNKPLCAPVVIAVFAVPSDNPRVIEIEEVEAVAAGVQNMLLTAQALGLGAMWRTGDSAYDDSVKAHLGFTPRDHLVAFVYLGYPDLIPPLRRDDGAGQFTRWMESDSPR